MSDKNQFEMRDLVDCIFYLHEVFDDLDKVSAWMMTKNPHLGNVEPMTLFWVGRGHKVLAFVKGALEDRLGIDASEGKGRE